MVKIRLSRTGRKNLPSYRVVVTDAREKRDSKFLELLGNYSPLSKQFEINDERTKYWLSVGAQPTERVYFLLFKKGLIKKASFERKYSIKPKKKNIERKEKQTSKAEAAK